MSFPIPKKYSSEAADISRDERKRQVSPPSFFFAQTQALLLTAGYFKDERLVAGYTAVADKHRNRIRSALFGQVMAAFEFCVKDFIAQAIDSSDLFDEKVNDAKWIDVSKSRILAQRESAVNVGAILIHPLLRWHDTDELNLRFSTFFQHQLLERKEAQTLQRLWILRHSVAHNSGFVTGHDAYRLQAPTLTESAIEMDYPFLKDAVDFLRGVVLKFEHGQPIGDAVLGEWLNEKVTGAWADDKDAYRRVRSVVTVVRKRTDPLPTFTKGMYSADRKRLVAP